MYRRRSGLPIRPLIILGLVAGIGYFVFDTLRNAPAAPTIPATVTPNTSGQNVSLEPDAPGNVSSNTDDASTVAGMFPDPMHISIPTIAVYTPIVDVYLDGVSWDVSQLGTNVGHLQGTAAPGEPGNIVLSGHVEMADGSPGVFATLQEVQVGDPIQIQRGDETWTYYVNMVGRTTPDDLTPLHPSNEDMITIITCGSYNFFQDSYLERIIVRAMRFS